MHLVQQIKQSKETIPTSLERMLGEEAMIHAREPVYINMLVRAEFLRISLPEQRLPEENGRLYLYPVADGKYNLQLLYVLEGDVSGEEVLWLQFFPEFFDMFDEEALLQHTPFRFDQTTEQQFNVCSQTRFLTEQLKNIHALTPFLQALQLTEVAVALLRRAVENVTLPFTVCPVPACRFLLHESEREKIIRARRILEESLEKPLTIKELSRRVAMNECYLKKGFKTLNGKTINEFQQELRISKARELLQQQGRTVSEVANALGYSSISHFSSAFKKATGIKPCELLG